MKLDIATLRRRDFLVATANLLTAGLVSRTQPDAVTTVQDSGALHPASVDLGNDMLLIDFRFHPGGWPAIVGELLNNSGTLIDSPAVSIIYPGYDGRSVFSWLSPTIPIMHPGESVPVFGPTPQIRFEDFATIDVTFDLCTKPEPGRFVELHKSLSVEMETRKEEHYIDSYSHQSLIHNTGGERATNLVTRGFIRDSSSRIAGLTPQFRVPIIPPGEARWALIEASVKEDQQIAATPFPLLTDAEYTIEVRTGVYTWESSTRLACDFGLPWDNPGA